MTVETEPALVVGRLKESGEFFFFQAEDGIRDIGVTGVQTCALPIYFRGGPLPSSGEDQLAEAPADRGIHEIGRASCRESVDLGGRRIIKKKKKVLVVGANDGDIEIIKSGGFDVRRGKVVGEKRGWLE